jgi:hypothetical protein
MLHLIVVFNMVTCICCVLFILSCLLHNEFLFVLLLSFFCSTNHIFVCLVIFVCFILLLIFKNSQWFILYFVPHLIILFWLMYDLFLVVLCKCFSFVVGNYLYLKSTTCLLKTIFKFKKICQLFFS